MDIKPFLILSIFVLFSLESSSQLLLEYDSDNLIAKVHYNDFLYATYQKHYKRLPQYPIVGAYGSSEYYIKGVAQGEGQCNYIYFQFENLEIGKQYRVKLTIELDKDYEDMPYFQKGLGFAIAPYLFKNKWGLWPKQYVPFGTLESDIPVDVIFEFRPMSKSKYLIIGGFPTVGMDDYLSNLSQHEFRVYNFELSKSSNPSAPFHYVGDAYAEEQLKQIFPSPLKADSIFFDSGSSMIKSKYKEQLRYVPNRLTTKQNLVHVFAYTDSKGDDNVNLGQKRAEAVKQELVNLGLDSERIIIKNFGETKASKKVSKMDRRVEVYPNMGKLYQKHYSDALISAQEGNYGKAHKIMRKKWMRLVPPENVIYALFDCWGNNSKASRFKEELRKTIKDKYYSENPQKFILDSLFLDNQIGVNIEGYIEQNLLPLVNCNCNYEIDWSREKRNQEFVDKFVKNNGFPSKDKVGKRGNKVIPEIILKSYDLTYLESYQTVFKKACENQLLSWRYYARLFDKINVIKTGFQRYGTMTYVGKEGRYIASVPIEDLSALSEYRRQVKLVTLSSIQMKELYEVHRNIDKSLVKELNDIYYRDQTERFELKALESLNSVDSVLLASRRAHLHKNDSLNLLKIDRIVSEYGWLGPNIIGYQGNTTIFLVIQHSNHSAQVRYLPILRNAVSEGNASASDLAYLEDRVLVAQGKKQIYGTQVKRDTISGSYIVHPIENPEKINFRRKQVGLGSIENYLKRWNIIWNPN